MRSTIEQLIQRLLLEETWRLLVDADEPVQLPDEEDYYNRLETEEDDEKYDALLIEFLGKQAQHNNAQPLVGGPLAEMQELAHTPVVEMDLTYYEPLLRPLKDDCRRVLVKQVLNRFIITLLVDQRPPQTLSREKLNKLGGQLIDQIDQFQKDMQEAELQELSGKALKKAKKQAKKRPKIKTTVSFEVVVVGDGVCDTNLSGADYQATLKQLQQRRAKRPISIQGYLLDSRNNRVWSTNAITGWRRRRYWRYALENREQSITAMRQELDNDKPKYLQAIATGIGAVIVTYAVKFALVLFTGTPGDFLALPDIIIPTLAGMTLCYSQRLNHFASVHMKWFLITYLSLFAVGFLAIVWPPGFNQLVYIGSIGFVTYLINTFAALMLEME